MFKTTIERMGRELQRWINRLPWRDQNEPEPAPPPEESDTKPEQPQPEPLPEPEPEPNPEPPPYEPPPPPAPNPPIRWFERNGRAVLQIRADYRATGRGVITAHHHRHIVPEGNSHSDWVNAVKRTAPQRRVDGYDEWTLPMSMGQIASRAQSLAPGSGSIVMIFAKGQRDVAYFIFADREYPPHQAVQNITNQEWRGMR